MQQFPSKVDKWIIIILIFAPALSTAAAIGVTIAEGPAGLFAFITPLFVLLLYRLVVWPIHYDVTEEDLIVHSGLTRRRVRLQEIRRITPSHNLLSSPALSIDRIRIDYGRHSFILLSPKDREGFAAAIKSRFDSVEVDERILPAPTRQTAL